MKKSRTGSNKNKKTIKKEQIRSNYMENLILLGLLRLKNKILDLASCTRARTWLYYSIWLKSSALKHYAFSNLPAEIWLVPSAARFKTLPLQILYAHHVMMINFNSGSAKSFQKYYRLNSRNTLPFDKRLNESE